MSIFMTKLAEMQQSWKDSQVEHDNMFSGADIAAGEYIFKLVNAELTESNEGNLMIKRRRVIVDGEFAGKSVFDQIMAHNPKSFAFVRHWIEQMGFACPEDLTELPELLLAIVTDEPVCKEKLTYREYNGSQFPVVRTIARLSEEESGEVSAESTHEESGNQEISGLIEFCQNHEIECTGGESLSAIKEIIDGYEWSVDDVTTEELELLQSVGINVLGADKNVSGTADTSEELLDRMLTFCATFDISVDENNLNFDSIKEAMGSLEYPVESLDAEETELLTDLGLEDKIQKPAPKPKVNKVLPKPKVKPAVKPEVKPAVKKSVKKKR